MRKFLLKSAFLVSFSVFLFACDKSVDVPSCIVIDKIGLAVDYATQGSDSKDITDAWVYIDNKAIGVFQLPAKFPVLKEGEHTIDVSAGIKLSGVGETRAAYPFYTIYSQKVNLTKGEVTFVEPTVSYSSFAKFAWIEDFESPGVTISKTSRSDTDLNVVLIASDVFEGNKSGAVFLSASQNRTRLELKSNEAFVLPTAGANVFLELNYKISETVAVGVYANTPSESIQQTAVYLKTTVNSSGNLEWKKIYINLSSVVSPQTSAKDFNIFIYAETSPEVPEPVFYFDNIKLVYQ